MKTCEYDGAPFTEPRSHPWTDARSSDAFRYYDLKAEPERIRTSLEDFTPWNRHAAIGQMYTLLEWLNSPRSTLESNDCAFSGPAGDSFECSGRVMVLYRALARNLPRTEIEALKNELHHALQGIDPELASGMIGTTLLPTRYVTLTGPDDARIGSQLMISFWAWGDTEKVSMASLARVLGNLSLALHEIATVPSLS